MIKRITKPEPIALEDFCDENDLTIIVTQNYLTTGGLWYKAEIQGSLFWKNDKSERDVLIRLAKEVSDKLIVIDGKMVRFPQLRCY